MSGSHKPHCRLVSCPHCDSQALQRKWIKSEKNCYLIIYQCQNTFCGFIFECLLKPEKTLRPSKNPSPLVDIPLSPRIEKNLLKDSKIQ